MKKMILFVSLLTCGMASGKVLDFKVESCSSKNACMTWRSEVPVWKCKSFDVMKSYDGKIFHVAGHVKFAGPGKYSFVDFFTTTGSATYKIREHLTGASYVDSDLGYYFLPPAEVDVCVRDSSALEIAVPREYKRVQILNTRGDCLFDLANPINGGTLFGSMSGTYIFRFTRNDNFIVERKIIMQ